MPDSNGQITEESLLHNGAGPDYLTPAQLAILLQVSVKSVQRWASTDPSMPMLRIGRTVRFPKERVLRWLRARERGMGRSKQSQNLVSSMGERVEKPVVSLTVSGPCAHS